LRLHTCTLAVLVGALVPGLLSAPAAEAAPTRTERPWKARRPSVPPPPSHQLLDTGRWPDEPQAPAQIEAPRFREALAYICRKPQDRVPSDEILASAREAGVDAFLLAALTYERSRCEPKKRSRAGVGLLGLSRALYDNPTAPGLKIHPSEWSTANLLSARANLSLGARLLRMWEEQHDAIDLAFPGVSHRSAVSHFLWGDVVLSSGSEDLVLTARRRLITRYNGELPAPQPSELGVPLVPPLESVPRVATSGPGDDRDGGARRHRGLDVVATPGEPVRAIADGTVIFAGVNLATNSRLGRISPARIASYAKRSLGAGGIYLCIRHDAAPAKPRSSGLVSCYMHLERYFVAQGNQVKAGETIAVVGRSGVKRSPPHLHFEVRVDGNFKDPSRYFSEAIIPPRETLTHKWNERSRKARLRAARAANLPVRPKPDPRVFTRGS
jgi:murein DD-endopeptidase MepM/ murein hydrolase activator NlpD